MTRSFALSPVMTSWLFGVIATVQDSASRSSRASSPIRLLLVRMARPLDPGVTCRGRSPLLPSRTRGRGGSDDSAAIAAARHAGVPVAIACEALGQFRGVRRRLETRGSVNGITVYDDFAHHPTAIATTIAGLRARIASGERIVAVLEPRSNTMKQGVMRAALPASLAGADLVYCYADHLGWDVAGALTPLASRAAVYADIGVMVTALTQVLRSGDHVLVMSNGGFGDVHARLLAALSAAAGDPTAVARGS